MKFLIIKLLLLVTFFASNSFGASQATVIFSKKLDSKYDAKVYRKTTILFTEARLKIQKKYKKYLNFEETKTQLTDKKKIITFLKSKGARYYVYLTIKDKSKGRCKNNKCKVDYIIKVFDAKKKKNTKLKIKAYISSNEFAEITPALVKSNTKRLVKFLK